MQLGAQLEMLCTCSTDRGPQGPPRPCPPSWVADRLCLPPGGEPTGRYPGPVTEMPQGASPKPPPEVKEEEEGPTQVPGTADQPSTPLVPPANDVLLPVPGTADQPSTPAAPPASDVLLPACGPEEADPDAPTAAAAAAVGGKCEPGAEKDPVVAPQAAPEGAEEAKGKAGDPAAPPQAWLPKA